jgi:hypothetical protein
VRVERNTKDAVRAVGLITVMLGAAHVTLSVAGNPGAHPNNWVSGFVMEGCFSPRCFLLSGMLAVMAGCGVLLRLRWGRYMSLFVGVVAILWGLIAIEARRHQERFQDVPPRHYAWRSILIPFAGVELLYGGVALVILLKHGAAFSRPGDIDEDGVGRRGFVRAAWASPSVGVVLFIMCASAYIFYDRFSIPEKINLKLFVQFITLASAAGGLAAVVSLFGVRSRWKALNIIPGAVLGILINAFLLFCSIIALLMWNMH